MELAQRANSSPDSSSIRRRCLDRFGGRMAHREVGRYEITRVRQRSVLASAKPAWAVLFSTATNASHSTRPTSPPTATGLEPICWLLATAPGRTDRYGAGDMRPPSRQGDARRPGRPGSETPRALVWTWSTPSPTPAADNAAQSPAASSSSRFNPTAAQSTRAPSLPQLPGRHRGGTTPHRRRSGRDWADDSVEGVARAGRSRTWRRHTSTRSPTSPEPASPRSRRRFSSNLTRRSNTGTPELPN